MRAENFGVLLRMKEELLVDQKLSLDDASGNETSVQFASGELLSQELGRIFRLRWVPRNEAKPYFR